ncbi:MAG: hypothetical protein V3V92_06900 [Candidatus Hydrothermarchaeales archaeon]
MLSSIPKIFQTLLALTVFISVAFFLSQIDFTNPEKADENLRNITEKMVNESIPTEITWIERSADKINNPYLLVIVIFIIAWLFGYIRI